MKRVLLFSLAVAAVLCAIPTDAAPISGLAWRDSAKVADTVIWLRGSPVNVVPTKSSPGTIDSFAVVGGTVTLPDGITLNKTTGALSGTPTANFAAANRTIRAYSGTDSLTRTVRMTVRLVSGLTWKDSTKAADTLVLKVGTNYNIMPTYLAFGENMNNWAITSNTTTLPEGITLNAATGAISGTPTAIFGAANRTITATSASGLDVVARTVRISAVIVSGLAWRDSTKPADTLAFRRGVAVNIVPTYNGGTLDSFVVVGNNTTLPDGIALNKTTGALSGTPTTTWAAANRTIRGYGSGGLDSISRTVRFSAFLVSSLAWKDSTKPADTLILTTSTPYSFTPSWLGGTLDSFAVIGAALPTGLSLNPATGVISGTPTTAFAAANRTLRGYRMSLGDSITRTVRFTVVNGGTQGFKYQMDTVAYAVGVYATNPPIFVGRAPTNYSVTPSLPAGLSLNAATGVISGRPTAASAAANYTVSAVDTGSTPDSTKSRMVRFSVAASEGYNTWAQHKSVWLNTAPGFGGVPITANVVRFPVLVRLDATSFGTGFSQVGAGRNDIRFTKSNDTSPLPFEIEQWDSTNASASIWVLVDTIYANNSTQTIRMHWGKAGVLSANAPAATFDTANGHRAVYHFTGTSNQVSETDATVSAYLASNRSTVDVQNPGVIGLGRDFNGTNEHFRVVAPPASFTFPANGSYTISAWADASVAQDDRIIVSKHGQAYTLKINASGAFEFSEYNNASGTATGGNASAPWALQSAAAPAAAAAGWNHVVGVSEGFAKRLYVNGALVTTNPGTAIANFTGAGTSAAVTTDTLTIGRQAEAAAGYWGGDLDEVRVDARARGADYIKLSYENQRIGSIFAVHAQPVAIRGEALAAAPVLTFQRVGQGILFRFQAAGSARADIAILDTRGRSVWARNVPTGSGMNEIAWDGNGNAGQRTPAGVYAVRISQYDGQNRIIRVLHAKLPLTR